MPKGINHASLGYVGWVRFRQLPEGQTSWLRATSADIRASQTVDKPDLVDGKTDKTVYQLSPIEVGGGVSFPAIYETVGSGGPGGNPDAPAEAVWKLAMQRTPELDDFGLINNESGDLHSFIVDVKYTTGTGFKYVGCVVNSYEFSISQGDVLNINLDLVGINRTSMEGDDAKATPYYNLRNTRIVQWNDVRVGVVHPSGAFDSIKSGQLRDFSITVENNVDRFYSLNGQLYPVAILPTKRDISGNFTLLGRAFGDNLNAQHGLSNYVYEATGNTLTSFNVSNGNQLRCNERGQVWFGYSLANTTQMNAHCDGSFYVRLPGCVFEIEELSITNDIFETSVNWHSLPGIEYLPESEGRDTTFIQSEWNGPSFI